MAYDSKNPNKNRLHSSYFKNPPKKEIIINKNKPIKLILDTKNEFLLKWTHKLYYIQKDSSNWLRTAIINLIVGITMYFIGQFIGFRSGYQDGLTKAQQEIQAPVQTQTKK